MRRIQLLFVICVGLWSAVAASSQASGGVLSAALRSHVQNEQFQIVTAIRGLPLGIRDELQRMFGSGGLDIANPGEDFQRTAAVANPNLPLRRLIAAACSNDHHCLVYYERGGREHTWHVALFQWAPDMTRLEWGGMAPGGLKTIEDVRSAILALKITGPPKFW